MGREPAATLRFLNDGTIEGRSACNRVSSPERWWNVLGYEFHLDGPGSRYRWTTDASGRAGRLKPADLAITLAGCGDRVAGRAGEAFWTAMEEARRWSVRDRQLTIDFADGRRAVLTAL